MVMKSRSNRVARDAPVPNVEPTSTKDGTGLDGDGLVMVVFPSETWAKVNEIAVASGASSAVVLSMAIELLEEKIAKGKE